MAWTTLPALINQVYVAVIVIFALCLAALVARPFGVL
jgi:hypothetical protein